MDLNRRPETDPVNDLVQLFSCSVCYERLEDDVRLCPSCSKLFCYSCITRCLTTHMRCPYCRCSIQLEQAVNCRWGVDVAQIIQRIERKREDDKRQSIQKIRVMGRRVLELKNQLQNAQAELNRQQDTRKLEAAGCSKKAAEYRCSFCKEEICDDAHLCGVCSKISCFRCLGQHRAQCPDPTGSEYHQSRWIPQVAKRADYILDTGSADQRAAILNSSCTACKQKIKYGVLCPRCSRLCCHKCIDSDEVVQRDNNYVCPYCHAGLAISDLANNHWIPRGPAIGSGVGADEDDEIMILQEIPVRTGNGRQE